MPNLVQLIKQAAKEAVEASKPSCFVFGTVISTKPLVIKIEQKLTLGEEFLIVPERIKSLVISAGDTFVLLQQKGGQKYLALDRMVKSSGA